jgi:hypothetical protein
MIPHDRMKHNLLATLRQVLRPLVRIALKNDVMFGDFANELRAAYLEVARDLSHEHGREPTEMRLRLMTGLPSSDLTWARRHDEQNEAAASDVRTDTHTIAATVLSVWHSDGDYALLYGIPSELPLTAPRGQTSFSNLVSRVDPTAEVMLVVERLIDAGCMREVAPQRYAAVSRVYMPEQLSADGLRYFGEAAGRFIDTLAHNLTSGESKETRRLERLVFADHGISETRLQEFQDVVKKQWDSFANPLDTWLNAPVPEVDSDEAPVVQTGVGIYHYVVREPAESASKAMVGDKGRGQDERKPN